MQRITTAPVGQRQHQHQQIGRYLISMGIRTACFVLAIFVPSPWRWVLVALAVVLPYIAVLVANAGRETPRPTTTQVTAPPQPALTRAPARSVDEPVVVGRVFDGPSGGSAPSHGAPRPAAPGGDSSDAAPRTWQSERLRPPSDVGSTAGGTPHRAGDSRTAA